MSASVRGSPSRSSRSRAGRIRDSRRRASLREDGAMCAKMDETLPWRRRSRRVAENRGAAPRPGRDGDSGRRTPGIRRIASSEAARCNGVARRDDGVRLALAGPPGRATTSEAVRLGAHRFFGVSAIAITSRLAQIVAPGFDRPGTTMTAGWCGAASTAPADDLFGAAVAPHGVHATAGGGPLDKERECERIEVERG